MASGEWLVRSGDGREFQNGKVRGHTPVVFAVVWKCLETGELWDETGKAIVMIVCNWKTGKEIVEERFQRLSRDLQAGGCEFELTQRIVARIDTLVNIYLSFGYSNWEGS